MTCSNCLQLTNSQSILTLTMYSSSVKIGVRLFFISFEDKRNNSVNKKYSHQEVSYLRILLQKPRRASYFWWSIAPFVLPRRPPIASHASFVCRPALRHVRLPCEASSPGGTEFCLPDYAEASYSCFHRNVSGFMVRSSRKKKKSPRHYKDKCGDKALSFYACCLHTCVLLLFHNYSSWQITIFNFKTELH